MNRDLAERIGLAIRNSRKEKFMRQKELAKRINIVPQYLSSVERGKRLATTDMLFRIDAVLDLNWFRI